MAVVGRDPINVHVGSRMRLVRRSHGLTQKQVAEVIDVSFQQFQKYERGLNRVAPGTLYRLAWFLGVPVAFFFEDLPAEALESLPVVANRASDDQFGHGGAVEERSGPLTDVAQYSLRTDYAARRLLTAYVRIQNRKLRIAIANFVHGIAQASENKTANLKAKGGSS